jgi:hypothetical protein
MLMLHRGRGLFFTTTQETGSAQEIDTQEEHIKKLNYVFCCKETMSLFVTCVLKI